MKSNFNYLKNPFEKLYHDYSIDYLSSDPLWFVHQYSRPLDQEIVAFIASAVAYGNVKQIFKTIKLILKELGNHPAQFVKNYSPEKYPNLFEGIYHRFHGPKDFRVLIYLLSQIYQNQESIGVSFQKHFCHEDENIGNALSAWIAEVLSYSSKPFYSLNTLPQKAPVRFFFSSPQDGSCCKRLNLFLRWMVRKDRLDLGLWDFIHSSKLIIPLDTHIFRVARSMNLTQRNNANWKTAYEITNNLKTLDPFDPIKYDFALTRLGILKIANTKEALLEVINHAGVTQR